jgi:hypothetical protein
METLPYLYVQLQITLVGGSLLSVWTAFIVVNISFVHPWLT